MRFLAEIGRRRRSSTTPSSRRRSDRRRRRPRHVHVSADARVPREQFEDSRGRGSRARRAGGRRRACRCASVQPTPAPRAPPAAPPAAAAAPPHRDERAGEAMTIRPCRRCSSVPGREIRDVEEMSIVGQAAEIRSRSSRGACHEPHADDEAGAGDAGAPAEADGRACASRRPPAAAW